jgi:hypothetical protein
MLLANCASIAKLIDMLDRRNPMHHRLVGEIMQRTEVEVSEPSMPQPSVAVMLREQAYRCGDLELHRVQSVAGAMDAR